MAISRDKAIVIGVVVLGALSFLVYRQAKHDQELGSADHRDLPDVKGTDDLDKIEITNGDKPTVTLQKTGDKWMVLPVNALANQSNVKSMLDNIKELKATEVVATKPDDDIKKTYNLDPAHVVHFVGYKGSDKKVDDLFGKSGGRGEMMMVSGKDQILGASGFSSYLYTREVGDWRDKEIFKFDDANATSVTITNKNGKFSFTKGDKWAGTFDGKPIPGFDDTKVADAVRSMKFLSADGFADATKTPDDAGLTAPQGVISVALKDGAGTYTLKVGNVSTGTSHFAVKDGGDGTIVTVNSNVSGWALAEPAKFAKAAPADAGAPKADAKLSQAPKPATKPH
ncbi:MAG: DUF4340 domain-containing protein [Polyangiaceae bacterium]|jgi:hypothetical protein